ncbi:MAG: uroporphyrinogen-III C-methyltransferase [Gammaproteobacteria bacterium]|nr:MAG: uroporphyrinogen-III C-methyltransferase [Gammaproteobacteria bacterium]
MEYLPIFMNIKGAPVLVVGGGAVASRKATLLIKAQADVTIVADKFSPLCESLAANLINRKFIDDDINDKTLIIAATDDNKLNLKISDLAKNKNIPVNVVDTPDMCSFILPAILDRNPVQIAISTGGSSPVLSRIIRQKLEGLIPSSYGNLGSLLAKYRTDVKNKFKTINLRKSFWEDVILGPISQLVFSGQEQKADDAIRTKIKNSDAQPDNNGEVYLVGAGPGDPDLLTFKALRLMQQADIVVYDRLVSKGIIEMLPRDIEKIYVGKERSNHTITQDKINQLLVDKALDGYRVLRLKGGDSFVFGRGAEEIETLTENKINFQIVPGITAASGCTTYAGIPLTHRDYSQACIFVTGHLKDGSIDLNWKMLSHKKQTVVFYMGLHGLKIITENLIKNGMDKNTPAALIQQGTTAKQRTFIGSLENLESLVEKHQIKAPTIIVVGEVVSLHKKLAWFGK